MKKYRLSQYLSGGVSTPIVTEITANKFNVDSSMGTVSFIKDDEIVFTLRTDLPFTVEKVQESQ